MNEMQLEKKKEKKKKVSLKLNSCDEEKKR